MENLINTQKEAFKAVFLFGNFNNVQGGRVFIPLAIAATIVILAFGHFPKF